MLYAVTMKSLRLDTADLMEGVELLRRAAIPMRRVYVQNSAGELEEAEI